MNNDVSEKEIREIKNQYFRKWRKENRDKCKKIQENYWARKAKEQKKHYNN